MQLATISRVLGLLLIIFSLSMLPPIPVTLAYGESNAHIFSLAFLLTLLTGIGFWLPFRQNRESLGNRDGFLIVVLFWFVLSFFGALPFWLASYPHIHMVDAIFESVSGLTTTGASVLSDLDHLSYGLRYYRQQLQFLGGMGIIVLGIAILPMLGVGGMQLYRAETPGPLKDTKLAPRITATAKILWFIYVSLNIACAFFYWLGGMSWFEAIGESFATISTGGFSLHSTSFNFYHSDMILISGIVFMFLGGANFTLHYFTWHNHSLKHYFKDSEFKGYVVVSLLFILAVFSGLLIYHVYARPDQALLHASFNVISMLTTTGYVTNPFGYWPTYIPFLIMIAALIGGCGGSTAGGIKIIRFMLLFKQCYREIRRLIHPHAIVPIKFGEHVLPEHVVQAMWGFLAAYLGLFTLLLMILLACHLDITTAFGALAGCMANAGAGIGQVSETFAHLPDSAKWILSFAMLLGRLEVFTILILFTPEFWRG
jgi:trk system potassium uptake protein TrkH